MATQSQKKPSYTFRAGWAILLLAVNFLVAAIYAHLINI
jgi:photosystem I protein